MNRERWRCLMRALHGGNQDATFEALCTAYDEPQRHYHTQSHIDDCLAQFEHLREHALDPLAIELAIWFHDAVYIPQRNDNERQSADWARRFLVQAGAEADLIEVVVRLILATRHDALPTGPDEALLIDVDLSILGADPERYRQFELDIRREYRWVPGLVYRRKRAAILESFLQRERNISHAEFHARYEAQAPDNLRKALPALRS
jgi:predicted metal-dependent HD superfamily phosphohydrolase